MKELVKTKTFWASVASICTGIGLIVSDEWKEGVVLIAIGLQGIFVRDSLKKIETKG